MRKLLPTAIAASAVALLLGGCANIILRTPLTSKQIKGVYHPTRCQAKLTMDVACPQSLFHPTGKREWSVANVCTVPLAVIPAADLVVEAALDTVFLPADACLAGSRTNKQHKE